MTFLSAPPFLLCTNNDTVPSLSISGTPVTRQTGFRAVLRAPRFTFRIGCCAFYTGVTSASTPDVILMKIFSSCVFLTRKNLEQACKIPLLPVGYPCPEKEFQDQFRNYIFSPAFSSQKIYVLLLRSDGGTGRRSGLKIRRPHGHGGSIPPPSTTIKLSQGNSPIISHPYDHRPLNRRLKRRFLSL
jgi:hypothetical protein